MYSRSMWERDNINRNVASVPPGYRGEMISSAEPSADEAGSPVTSALESIGLHGGVTSDDILLCAVILMLASDNTENVGDILLILALLLTVR